MLLEPVKNHFALNKKIFIWFISFTGLAYLRVIRRRPGVLPGGKNPRLVSELLLDFW
jgi:hypothetical protein